MKESNIAAIVLAAGSSSRYGGANKLLLPFGDGVVVQRVVRTVKQTSVARILVVTGHQHVQVMDALHAEACEFAHNPRHAEGEMISSIRVGLARLLEPPEGCSESAESSQAQPSGRWAAALIVLGDQPLLPARVIERLVEAFEYGCGDIIAPRFGTQRGHPVLIARKFWGEAMALPDGSPMRALLARHSHDVTHILVNTNTVLLDVDTPELYREAVQEESNVKRKTEETRTLPSPFLPLSPAPLPRFTTDPNTTRSLPANRDRG